MRACPIGVHVVAGLRAGRRRYGRGSRRRVGPGAGDDGVEFGRQQFWVAADQVEELIIPRRVAVGSSGKHDGLTAQVVIARRCPLALAMEILRGLARSATGISRVRTPV